MEIQSLWVSAGVCQAPGVLDRPCPAVGGPWGVALYIIVLVLITAWAVYLGPETLRADIGAAIRPDGNCAPITSIFVTHHQEEALEVADQVVLMNKALVSNKYGLSLVDPYA